LLARDADLLIEAIVERLDAKQRLFVDLAALVAPTAVLASNTSSLSITAIAAGLADPTRSIGLHFFNPVPARKLIEIVLVEQTEPSLFEAMAELMRGWNEHLVTVRDVPRFIVNRVARPFNAEAFDAKPSVCLWS